MKRVVWALVGIFTCVAAACADSGDACGVAQHLVHADAAVPRAAAAIKAGALTVAVIGTTSSTLPGANSKPLAYPARLEAVLQKKLPNVTVKVISLAKPRQTAQEMAQGFSKLLRDEKPSLVVWQTGTADAMVGVATEDFQSTLEQAVDYLHAGGADVVLMNMQYSPRTDIMIGLGPYADNMRVVAQQHEVPLFDRLAIMRHWSDTGAFDLYAAGKDNVLAHRVHDCIGRSIASMIIDAAHLRPADLKVGQ